MEEHRNVPSHLAQHHGAPGSPRTRAPAAYNGLKTQLANLESQPVWPPRKDSKPPELVVKKKKKEWRISKKWQKR